MKTTPRFSLAALSAVFVIIHILPFGVKAQTAAPATAVTTTTTAKGDNLDKLVQSLNSFNRLDEIAQLTRAGVGDPVILAYIKNSETAYNVSAQDIIKLRDQGVSAEVTAALIQRGTEVRQAVQEAAKVPQPAVAAAAPADQPPPEAAVPVSVPVTNVPESGQPVSTVSVTYIGYPDSSYAAVGYPRYVTFGSSYCAIPQVACGVGFGGYRFGRNHANTRFCR